MECLYLRSSREPSLTGRKSKGNAKICFCNNHRWTTVKFALFFSAEYHHLVTRGPGIQKDNFSQDAEFLKSSCTTSDSASWGHGLFDTDFDLWFLTVLFARCKHGRRAIGSLDAPWVHCSKICWVVPDNSKLYPLANLESVYFFWATFGARLWSLTIFNTFISSIMCNSSGHMIRRPFVHSFICLQRISMPENCMIHITLT